MTNNFLVDDLGQAIATVAGNPAYANTVAGLLYMNVAMFRMQQSVMENTAYTVHEAMAVPAVAGIPEYAGTRTAA